MQKILIGSVIDDLKNTTEWARFYSYLRRNEDKFNNDLDYFLWSEIILDLINNQNIHRWTLTQDNKTWMLNRYYGWNLDNKDVIKPVKDRFIKLFIEKIKFCPICWKVPLVLFNSEISTNKGRLFDLDHFFPKSKYQHLAINFYNLIPACKWCNYIKNENDPMGITGIFHPYFWFLDNVNWNEKFEDRLSFIDESIYQSNHSKFFKLLDVYTNSQDTDNDIWFIKDKIEKIKAIEGHLSGKLSLHEKKEYFFQNFYPREEHEILKFSNWKLKKDWITSIT